MANPELGAKQICPNCQAKFYDLGRRLRGRTFEYLLTRFTEPNELFGPFDIRRLRDGDASAVYDPGGQEP